MTRFREPEKWMTKWKEEQHSKYWKERLKDFIKISYYDYEYSIWRVNLSSWFDELISKCKLDQLWSIRSKIDSSQKNTFLQYIIWPIVQWLI